MNPLWMPRGSVRSLLALLSLLLFAAVVIVVIVAWPESDLAAMVVGAAIAITQGVYSAYFRSRGDE